MTCQNAFENMLLCNKPDEFIGVSHTVVRIFCPVVIILSLTHGVVVWSYGWVGRRDQKWTDSGSRRRLIYKLTSDLTQLEN